MDYKTADRLIELRKKHGYSQEELAEKLYISRQAVSKWERAESLPDTENLIALAGLYKISIDKLIHGVDAKASGQPSSAGKPVRTGDMSPVRTPFWTAGIVELTVGMALLVAAAVLLGLSFAFDSAAVALALRITSGALGFSGLVELILGTVFYAIAVNGKNRMTRLKQSGLKFGAKTIELKKIAGVRAGRYISARLECSYTNHEGKSCLVKSRIFLAQKDAIYDAIIYVNPNDPTDYAVEVLSRSKAHFEHDHDYR